jgi:L-threonylcarbamoyladenylate synthase
MIRPFDDRTLSEAIDRLRSGALVAFPTETVYGLGARADDSAAVAAIYAAKGRPAENPSIVHVASAAAAFALAADVPAVAVALAARFWPGPLTLVLRARAGCVARETLAGGDTIALRVPAHPVAQAILAGVALPIAAPSANRSTSISPTTAAHVEASLGVDTFIVDGGATGFGIESTIVDVTGELTVLRRGSISLSDLGTVAAAADRGSRVEPEGQGMRAPGGMARHYAPRAPASLRARECLFAGTNLGRTGFLLLADTPGGEGAASIERLPNEPVAYARGLYAALHRLDAAALSAIVIEEVPEDASWAAIRDRLTRATS